MTRRAPSGARHAGAPLLIGACVVLAGCGGGSTATTTVAAPPTTVARKAAAPTTTTIADDSMTDLGGASPFAATSPWNTSAESLPIADRSRQMLRLAAQQPVQETDQTYLQRRGSRLVMAINLTGWAPGIYAVGTGTSMNLLCRQDPCGKPGNTPPSTLLLPDDLVADSGHDGWLVLVDRATDTEYDLWRARRVGSTLSFEFSRRWDLSGSGAAPPATSETARSPSVRGSGLPLLAGLIRPAELRAGHISHALAIAVPGPAAGLFVYPAGTANGLGGPLAVPEGARLRLKASAYERLTTRRPRKRSARTGAGRSSGTDAAGTADAAQETRRRSKGAAAVLEALATYGAIVVERADSPTLYAQRNADYRGLLAAKSLDELRLSDFTVVRLGRVSVDPAAPPRARSSQESR